MKRFAIYLFFSSLFLLSSNKVLAACNLVMDSINCSSISELGCNQAWCQYSDGWCAYRDNVYLHDGCELYNGTGDYTVQSRFYMCPPGESPCGGGSGCFTPDTKVEMSDGSEKEIKDIKEGDVVKSFDPETGEITESIVTDPYIIEKKEIYTIETTDGEKIKATAEHPFYVGVENQEDKTFGQKILAPFTKLKSYFVSGLYVLRNRT